MSNNRIYYAAHQVVIEADGGNWDMGEQPAKEIAHGVQSVSMSTNFNLEQVFELGQISIYENIEDLPDVEVSLSKVLDGYPLLFHMATQGDTTVSPSLSGRSVTTCKFGLGIWPDTNDAADATTPPSVVVCSGMFVGSVSYTFAVDDNFSEDLTLVGNHKIWKNGDNHLTNPNTNLPWDSVDMNGGFAGATDAPIGTAGVNRRQDFIFEASVATTDVNGAIEDYDCTILPPDVFGISSSGTNDLTDDVYGAHISNISVSVDLGREDINELGRRSPYTRTANFPVEVTCEIEVTSISGDMVSATEEGIYTTGEGNCVDNGNLANRTIRIATCEGTRIYLGLKNKLSSANYTGGDAGGGNVSVTYSFSTFNDFTVMHTGDPHASGSAWWSARATYLVG